MAESRLYVYVGLISIFIATFSIIFIFVNVDRIMKNCEIDPTYSHACGKLNGTTTTILMLLLIVGGLVIALSVTAYILLSAKYGDTL